ncbi:MAG: hypothetical protein EOM50_12890 [Erysipelotrichia bacterium]|nr:hypothetical protein [Erysipelotrichia bacterium]NCC54848.1 hypothetical protein [Erysipelotrichia bacterium]
MRKDLLMYVFEKNNLTYLSDLKFMSKDVLLDSLDKIDTDNFSSEEWCELLFYITGKKCSCTNDAKEIKKQLIALLEQK